LSGLAFGGLLGPVLSLEVLNRFLEISLKCGLVFLVAVVLASISKRQPAKVRARIWAMTLLGFLIVAAFSFAPAPVRFSLIPHSVGFRLDPETAPLESLVKNPPFLSARSENGAQERLKGVDLIATATRAANLLVLIWIAGVLWNLGRWISARRRFVKKAFRSESAAASVQATLSESMARARWTRPIRLSQSPDLKAAWTWGLRNPVVLLPGDADRWPKPALAMVLEHELAHIRRRDSWIEALSCPIATFLWFHPAAWISLKRLRGEREKACDDAVLEKGAKPSEYATQLLKMAASLGPLDRKSYPELALSGRDGLKGRLAAILGPRGVGGARRSRIGALLVAGAVFLIGPLAVSSFWLETGKMNPHVRAYWESGKGDKKRDFAYALEDALVRGGWTSAYARLLQTLNKGKMKLTRDRTFYIGMRLLLDKNSLDEARSMFRFCAEVFPDMDAPRQLREQGDLYLKGGKTTRAMACYEMAIALNPEVQEELGAKLDSLRAAQPEKVSLK